MEETPEDQPIQLLTIRRATQKLNTVSMSTVWMLPEQGGSVSSQDYDIIGVG